MSFTSKISLSFLAVALIVTALDLSTSSPALADDPPLSSSSMMSMGFSSVSSLAMSSMSSLTMSSMSSLEVSSISTSEASSAIAPCAAEEAALKAAEAAVTTAETAKSAAFNAWIDNVVLKKTTVESMFLDYITLGSNNPLVTEAVKAEAINDLLDKAETLNAAIDATRGLKTAFENAATVWEQKRTAAAAAYVAWKNCLKNNP